MSEAVIERLLEITRQEGHFELGRSGLHSNVKFVCDPLFQDIEFANEVTQLLVDRICESIARCSAQNDRFRVDAVLGVSGGGKVLATLVTHMLAEREMGIKKVVLSRRVPSGSLEMETGFQIRKWEKYLVIEDVVTSGTSIRDALNIVGLFQAEMVGVACLIDRSAGRVSFPARFQDFLAQPQVDQWNPEECPLCQKGIPLQVDYRLR